MNDLVIESESSDRDLERSYIKTENGSYYCDHHDENNIIGIGSFANIYKGLFKKNGDSSPVDVALKYLNTTHIDMILKEETTNVEIEQIDDGSNINKKNIDLKLKHQSSLYNEANIMKTLQNTNGIVQLLDADFGDNSTDTNNNSNNTHQSSPSSAPASRMSSQCIILEMASCTLCDFMYDPVFINLFQDFRYKANNSNSNPYFLLKIQLCWLLNCFEGLQYMHEKDIIHHDIKPDNIFFFPSVNTSSLSSTAPNAYTGLGCMKIADFGLSHFIHHHTSSSSGEAHSYGAVSLNTKNHNNHNHKHNSNNNHNHSGTTTTHNTPAITVSVVAGLEDPTLCAALKHHNHPPINTTSSKSHNSNSHSNSPRSPRRHHKSELTATTAVSVSPKHVNNNNNNSSSKSPKSSSSLSSASPLKTTTDLNVTVTEPTIDPAVICKGQPAYQPPELFFYPPKCTSAVDVYGMTIVLNEVLTYRKPTGEDCLQPALDWKLCHGNDVTNNNNNNSNNHNSNSDANKTWYSVTSPMNNNDTTTTTTTTKNNKMNTTNTDAKGDDNSRGIVNGVSSLRINVGNNETWHSVASQHQSSVTKTGSPSKNKDTTTNTITNTTDTDTNGDNNNHNNTNNNINSNNNSNNNTTVLPVIPNYTLHHQPLEANVLHSAGSLPVQICGGLRPHLYDGKINVINNNNNNNNSSVTAASPTNTSTVANNSNNNNINNTSTNIPATTIAPEVIQRIQHLIRTGWSTKPTDRPLAKGVVTTLKKILDVIDSLSVTASEGDGSDCESELVVGSENDDEEGCINKSSSNNSKINNKSKVNDEAVLMARLSEAIIKQLSNK